MIKGKIRRFWAGFKMGFSSLLFLAVILAPILLIYKWKSEDSIICFYTACYYFFVSILGFEGLKKVFKKAKAGLLEKKPDLEAGEEEKSTVPEIKINQNGGHFYSICNMESYNPTTVISKKNIIDIVNPKHAEHLPSKCSYNWNVRDLVFCINADKSEVYEDSDGNYHVYFDYESFIKTDTNFPNPKFYEAFYSEINSALDSETKQKYFNKQLEKLNSIIEKQKETFFSDSKVQVQLRNIFFPQLSEEKLLIIEKSPCTTNRYTKLWDAVQNGTLPYKRRGVLSKIFANIENDDEIIKPDKKSKGLVKV